MGLEILNINKDRKDLYPLLKRAHDDVYVPAFQNPETRESLEKITDMLEGRFQGVELVVNIVGQNLKDPAKAVIKGISIAVYYSLQNVGLLAYNAIDPNHREGGLGKLMVNCRIDSLQALAKKNGHQQIDGVFIEVNDPQKVSRESDPFDPAKRVAIFQKWGARMIPIDYIQPPLSPDGYYYDCLKLMNYPVNGKYAAQKDIENFLRAIYREGRSSHNVDQDYYFLQMKKQLPAWQDGQTAANDNLRPAPGQKAAPGYRFV